MPLSQDSGKDYLGIGEMAQCLEVFATLPKDPGFVPSSHVVAHNHL